MSTKNLILIFFISLSLMVSSAFGEDADSIVGLWSTPENKSKIKILKCGDKYCGRLATLKEPNYPADDKEGMAGKPKVDRKNPNLEFRAHHLVGLQLMQGFSYSGGNIWEGGKIYDPENGKFYRCKITLSNPKRLEVRGYIGFSFIGETSVWTR